MIAGVVFVKSENWSNLQLLSRLLSQLPKWKSNMLYSLQLLIISMTFTIAYSPEIEIKFNIEYIDYHIRRTTPNLPIKMLTFRVLTNYDDINIVVSGFYTFYWFAM